MSADNPNRFDCFTSKERELIRYGLRNCSLYDSETDDEKNTVLSLLDEACPDKEVWQEFLLRDDIACLPVEEQEKRWALHKVALDKFRGSLSSGGKNLAQTD